MRRAVVILLVVLGCGQSSSPLDQRHGFTTGSFLPPTQSGNTGGGGTVTSVSGGTGVTVTNGTTTPSIALDSSVWQSRVTGTAGSHNAITAIAANGSVTSAGFFDTAGAGLASSGAGDVHVNVAGGTCSNGQAVTTVSASGAATCGNTVPNNYTGTHFEWFDEFMWSQAATNGTIPDGWLGTNISGTGAAISGSVTGTTTRPGIVDIATGTTTTGRAALNTGNQSIDFGSGLWDYVQVGGFPTLSTSTDGYAALIGFFDVTNAVDQTDGCYFLSDERQTASAPATGSRPAAASATLAIVCASNAARTEYPLDGTLDDSGAATGVVSISALTLPSTGILNLEVREVSSSEMDFYSAGVRVGVITTHIPTGAARLTGAGTLLIKSVGTTSRDMNVDRVTLKVDLTGARSP